MRGLGLLLALLLAPLAAAAQPMPTYQWITLQPQGSPPPAVDGRCWTSSTGLFCRINGGTVGPYVPAAGASLVVGSTPITGGAAGRVVFDNGGVLGEYTAASLTAQINAFTSGLSGAAPASGGGTANFLRADGTWATPPGTAAPGGLSGNVQTNNGAGGFAGLTNTQLTADINAFTALLSGAAPASGGGTANFLRADGTWAVPPGTASGTVTTTGTPASGNLPVFSGASSITNGNLSGDASTAGTLVVTVGKVNGVAYGTSPSSNTVPVVTGANTVTYEALPLAAVAAQSANTVVGNVTAGSAAPTAASLPSCSDTGGNHLNYVSGSGFTCGTSTGAGGVQRLTTQIGPVGNGNDTSEDNLLSFTLSAGQLASNGQSLEIVAYGTFAIHSGTTRTARCYFGATQIGVLSTGGTAAITQWQLTGWVHRTGAATQFSFSSGTYGASGANVTATEMQGTTPSETLSGAITVKCTGTTGTAQANDVVQNILQINFFP